MFLCSGLEATSTINSNQSTYRESSDGENIDYGVAQGSTIGPLIF